MNKTDLVPRKRWRVPDESTKNYAVWYGPGGKKGEHATEVEKEGSDYRVSEYTFVGAGYFDEPPEADFLKTTTYVRPKRPMSLRDVVDVGVQILSYYGGDEEFVDSLP